MIKATGKEWRYAYDAYDRLLSAGLFPNAASSSPEQNVVYTLDALNRRVQRQEQRPQGNFARENYYHDGWDIDSVDERFNQTLTRRAWFSMVGVDNPYAMTVWNGTSGPSTTSYYYSSDLLGSTRALHADNGTIVAQYDYDTYGVPEVLVESVLQPFLYTGREYDRVTGLYHYRARDYDPNNGRFLQEDPIWFNAGDHNVYRYVGSRPTRFTDPSGMAAGKEKAAIVAGLALSPIAAQMLTAERINCNLGIIASALHFARENAFIDDSSAAIIGAIDDVACVVVGSRKPPRATPTPGITPGKPGKGGGGPGKGGGSNNAGGGGGSGGGGGAASGNSGPPPPSGGGGGNPPRGGSGSGADFVVDSKGNAIPLKPGEWVQSSPDGRFVQGMGPNGPTGYRIDGGHRPSTHSDPRAQGPHGHVPGMTNPDGTPWLPIK